MRVIIQRVEKASVTIAGTGEETARIRKGVVCLLGIGKHDHKVDVEYCARKCLGLRLWEDSSGKPWQKSVVDMGYEVLVVSNFTLQGKTKKGSQPDFSQAMAPDSAKTMYEDFVANLRSAYDTQKIHTGQFQTKMAVEIINDGPVTVMVDTKDIQLNRGPTSSSSKENTNQTKSNGKSQEPAEAGCTN